MSSASRTSVQYIQIGNTQTTPHIGMQALERMPARFVRVPNKIGRMNPPRRQCLR